MNRLNSDTSQVRNNTVKKNIIYPLTTSQRNFFYWNGMLNTPTTITIQNDMKLIAKFDSNYYRDDVTNPFDYYYHLTSGGTFFDPASLKFAAWKTFILGDSTSKIIAPTYVPFYNTTNASVVQALDGTYKDVYGNSYVGSITLQAYSSALLTKISTVIAAPATPTPAPVLPSDTTITPMTSSYTFTITTSSAQQAILSIYYSKLLSACQQLFCCCVKTTLNTLYANHN
jgi:hypothetical protein